MLTVTKKNKNGKMRIFTRMLKVINHLQNLI